MSTSADALRTEGARSVAWEERTAPLSFLESPLFGAGFVPGEMRAIFGYDAFLRRCVETEVALANAQARLGIIPAAAAAGIAETAATYRFDIDRLARETAIVGYPVLPMGAVGGGGRRSGPISALGHHHPGYHGHGDGAADPRGTGSGGTAFGEDGRGAAPVGARSPRNADGGAPTFSTPCRSPSATRRRGGSPGFRAIGSGSRS